MVLSYMTGDEELWTARKEGRKREGLRNWLIIVLSRVGGKNEGWVEVEVF